MKKIPSVIYLQAISDGDDDDIFSDIGTTWASEKINDDDIRYVRDRKDDRAMLEEAVKFMDDVVRVIFENDSCRITLQRRAEALINRTKERGIV